MTSPRPSASLLRADRELLHSLENVFSCRARKGRGRNAFVQRSRTMCCSVLGLKKFQSDLERAGAFAVRLKRVRWKDTDGERRTFTLARAASTEMWPMGTHYWVRDNAIIGARYLFSGKPKMRALGKELLLSALTFMSSVEQLRRFNKIIRASSAKYRDEANHWPYIFAGIKDNLSATKPEPWAHKQDAWQVLAYYILEALEAGFISHADLTSKHRKFFGLLIPFLVKVSFWQCESSGSWEELSAVRTSVRAWEHRVIVKLMKAERSKKLPLLSADFLKLRKYLPSKLRRSSLEECARWMERKVILEVVRDLPYESPRYRRSDPRYRRADAALIYILMIDYPYFLAARLGQSIKWAHRLEETILRTVMTLDDPLTGGMYRYGNDSYQRSGFFRNTTISKLNALYGAPSGDASKHFVGRDRVVPKGRKAAWTHFVWQLAAWSGRRFLDTGSKRYRKLHEGYFEKGLGLLTGDGEVTIEQDLKGQPRVEKVPPLRMPECYISDKTKEGSPLVFPSPHTPLNWSVAEMFDAFQVRAMVLKA